MISPVECEKAGLTESVGGGQQGMRGRRQGANFQFVVSAGDPMGSRVIEVDKMYDTPETC